MDKLSHRNKINEINNKQRIEPLSFSQQQMWIIDQMQPGNHAYNLPVGFRLKGNLKVEILEKSFNEIIRRHETLRTTFSIIENQPRQLIHPECSIKIRRFNLDNLTSEELEKQLNKLIQEEVTQPFNLSSLPLIRVTVIKFADNENIFILNLHHIICDGWSLGIIFQELSEFYNSFYYGTTINLPELPIQYSEYVNWQLQKKWTPSYNEQLDFWTVQLDGVLPNLELPFDKRRPTVQSLNGSNEFFYLSKDLTQKIQSVGIKKGCTFFMTVLAAFQVFLSKYSGMDDIIIGTPVSNRPRKVDENIIGNFLNIVALRTDLSDNPDFASLLQRTQKIVLDALNNRDLPFENIVEYLKIKRDLSRNPVFQVMLQVLPKYSFELSNLQISNLNFDLGYSQFDLSLHLYQVEDGYNCRFEYNTDLFETSTIKRMESNFLFFLDELAGNPDRKISEISILNPEEIKLLHEWNNSEVIYEKDATIIELFEKQVDKDPSATAVKFGNDQITYRELNKRANQLANYLLKKGIKPGAVVGICIDRSISMVLGLLAIIKVGAAYLPLDPSFPKERLKYIVNDSQISVFLTEENLSELIYQFNVNPIYIDVEWETICNESDTKPNIKLEPSDLIYIIYTSGSTGNPKGVMIENQAFLNFLYSMSKHLGFYKNDVLLAVTTISFDIAGLELFLPLINGGQVVIAAKSDTFDGKAILDLIAHNKVNYLQATPSTWKMMLETGWKMTPDLKMLCGGENYSKELADKMLESGYELWNMYGPTETTIWSSVHKIERGDRKVLIGAPIANTQFFVVDKNLNPVPIGVAGELLIGGVGLARGYLGRKELTEEKFIVKSFFNKSRRLYRTGDIVRYHSDGKIEFLGRTDSQVKIRGFRIELGEIESKLLQHENIKEAVVIVSENDGGEKRLVAYIIPNKKNVLEISTLRSFLKEKIPEYMIPSFFVEVEVFPLTPNGKLDRKSLPEYEESTIKSIRDFLRPLGKTEITLAGLWKKILNLEIVGANDNFFEIGGSSLSLMNLKARITDLWEVSIPIRTLYNEATIKEQAILIELLTQQFNVEASDNLEDREVFEL